MISLTENSTIRNIAIFRTPSRGAVIITKISTKTMLTRPKIPPRISSNAKRRRQTTSPALDGDDGNTAVSRGMEDNAARFTWRWKMSQDSRGNWKNLAGLQGE